MTFPTFDVYFRCLTDMSSKGFFLLERIGDIFFQFSDLKMFLLFHMIITGQVRSKIIELPNFA